MRNRWHNLGLISAAILAGMAGAVPPNSGGDVAYPQEVVDAAVQYADALQRFVEKVHERYERRVPTVGLPNRRPAVGGDEPAKVDERAIVPKAELYEAAIQGLYEAARHPVPPKLREQLEVPQPLEVLIHLRAELGNHEAIRDMQALRVSIAGLTKVLDPYSGLIGPRDFATNFDRSAYAVGLEFANAPVPVGETTEMIFNNRGIIERRRNTTVDFPNGLPSALLVKTVIPGSPAQQAGIRPGDRITAIAGKPMAQCEPGDYARTFYPDEPDDPRGTAGATRQVTVERPGTNRATSVRIVPRRFVAESVFGIRRHPDGSWDHLLDTNRKIGYLRVGHINLETSQAVEAALRNLQTQEAGSLILDLRWCPGGYLKEAIEVAKCFLPPDAEVFLVTSRHPLSEAPRVIAEPELRWPILVLVNGATTGGGELIAAALQDHSRAAIAGERTFGKASIQSTLVDNPFPDLAFKLTTGTFYRYSGKNLHRFPDSRPTDDWGVRPNAGHWLPLSPAASKQLKELWTWHILRPAGSREPLPIDDPEVDPQLKAAVEMISRKVKS